MRKPMRKNRIIMYSLIFLVLFIGRAGADTILDEIIYEGNGYQINNYFTELSDIITFADDLMLDVSIYQLKSDGTHEELVVSTTIVEGKRRITYKNGDIEILVAENDLTAQYAKVDITISGFVVEYKKAVTGGISNAKFIEEAVPELRVESVYPASGIVGHDLEVTLTGAEFDENTRVSMALDVGHKRAIIGSVDTFGSARGVTVVGDNAYVACIDKWISGLLQVIDISDPANPVIIGSVDTPGYAWGVTVAGDKAYVLDGDSGLVIVPLPIEISPVTVESDSRISFTIPAPMLAGDYILRVFNGNESDEIFITFSNNMPDMLEFSGDVVYLTGVQTEDIVWNESNFNGFCYALGDELCIGSESLTIMNSSLAGPDNDRIIDENELIYTTQLIQREYEIHKDLGLMVDNKSHYSILSWMGERYVALNGSVDKLAKPLVEFNSDDIKTLAIGEEWEIGGGFVLKALELDIDGEEVWLCLYKDGEELDNTVVRRGDVYTYREDISETADVPVFSCYVSGVLCGTCSNLVQIKYLFLIDTDSLINVNCGDEYGTMEVLSVSPSGIVLKNKESIELAAGANIPIMGQLSLQRTDSTNAIEIYPYILRKKPPILSGGGGFAQDNCGIGSAWNLLEGYSIAAKDVSVHGDKARIVLLKDGVVVDERILTTEDNATADMDSHYRYFKDEIEIINATLKKAFYGRESNVVELANLCQRSEVNGAILVENASHLFKSANPVGISWSIADGCLLTMKDVGINGDEIWLELSKNNVVVKEDILDKNSGRAFVYTYGAGGISCVVDRVFLGCDANLVKLVKINQYSEVDGTPIITDGFHLYRSGDTAGIPWDLPNRYVLVMKDIDPMGDEVWLELSRDEEILKSDTFVSGESFAYESEDGIVNCRVDEIFCGTGGEKVVKLTEVNQYSQTGIQLIDSGTKIYATANPMGDEWEFYEGYSLNAKAIDLNGAKAWLSLSKDGVIVKEAIIDSRKPDIDRWFEYYDSSGRLIFRTYLYNVFSGQVSNLIQLKYLVLYSEIDGSVLMQFGESERTTLYAGGASSTLPLIATPVDGRIFNEGKLIQFSGSASGGAAPYTYTWHENGDVIGTGESFNASFGHGSHIITLIISDAGGTNVSDCVRVEIKNRLRGDINCDGAVTLTDLIIALRIIAGYPCDAGMFIPADINGDGRIGLAEAIYILKVVAGT